MHCFVATGQSASEIQSSLAIRRTSQLRTAHLYAINKITYIKFNLHEIIEMWQLSCQPFFLIYEIEIANSGFGIDVD